MDEMTKSYKTPTTFDLVGTSATSWGHSGCLRGRFDDNYPHDFADVEDRRSGQPYIYCRMCGEVRKVETP